MDKENVKVESQVENKESFNKEQTENYMTEGMFLGICLGMTIGQFLFDNFAVGMTIGMCLGLAVGSGIRKRN